MAGVKISQLVSGGAITSQDEFPIARAGVETYKLAASQIVTDGANVGVGSGQLYFGKTTVGSTSLQFRSLSGVDGLSVVNQGNTLVISASGQNPVKTSITGNGTTTTFAVNGAGSINPNNYRVDIDGVLQEPINDYTIVGSNIVFNPAPPAGSKVTVVSNNLVRAYDIIPSDGSVTSNKIVDQAVTSDKIALSGVDTANINNNAITFAKLAPSSKILASGTLTGTTDIFLTTTFTISQPGWLITTGYGKASYIGTNSNAGNAVYIRLNATVISEDFSFEGESGSITFRSSATGMSYLSAGAHTIQLEHEASATLGPMTRIASRLSWVVFPI